MGIPERPTRSCDVRQIFMRNSQRQVRSASNNSSNLMKTRPADFIVCLAFGQFAQRFVPARADFQRSLHRVSERYRAG